MEKVSREMKTRTDEHQEYVGNNSNDASHTSHDTAAYAVGSAVGSNHDVKAQKTEKHAKQHKNADTESVSETNEPIADEEHDEYQSIKQTQQQTKQVPQTVHSLQAENTELRKAVEGLTVHLQRLQAEFENYSKRTAKDFEKAKDKGAYELVLNLLDVLDSLALAVAKTNSKNPSPESEGLKLVYAKLWHVLEKAGLSPIESIGKKFDPYLHEAMLQDTKEEYDDGIILEELQKGYSFRGYLLRTAKVKVNRLNQQKSG